jgi:MerR family copper efflux transcriptional regulator
MAITETRPGRYRIAEIARLSGFSPSALRYYEQAGVLAAPERTPAGYRLYDDRDVERLRLVARAKDLGCTLEEITDLIEAWDSDECEPVKHRLRALVLDKVAEIETRLAEQTAFADQLRATADALSGRPLDGPCNDSCGCTTSDRPQQSGPETTSSGTGCAAGCGCATDDRAVGPTGPHPVDVAASEVPIACSLSGTDMVRRVEDWQGLLDAVTRRLPIAGGLRLELDDRTHITELAQLVEAEQSCCPFYSFVITIDHQGLALEVTAPTDGQELLATFFGEHQ